jgi:DUF1680 family protein
MKKGLYLLFAVSLLFACNNENSPEKSVSKSLDSTSPQYLMNRTPLVENRYLELPLGTIKADGWLKEQLERMASGMTGNLDQIYPEVVGARNGWLGGDGDGWERGPYWIDGLLPLAHILDDADLKNKVRPWIEWTLNNQTEEGYIGPIPFEKAPQPEAGLQKGNRKDWWPKMVMLKILQQHYSATKDERVIEVLTKYFKYQLEELPNTPLDNLSHWANRRGGDNLQIVYWLYNLTGDKFLLELGEIIQEQTFPWTTVFLNEENHNDPTDAWHYSSLQRYPFDSTEINNLTVSKIGGIHTVNFAQGLKQPVVAYQRDKDQRHLAAVEKALKDIQKYHGQAQGMYGGDEPLHGSSPEQGIEFCSVSEEMFSLETMIKITGNLKFADLLERITFNALPAQASDDFNSRQYFQAANQIELSDRADPSFENLNHKGTDFVFGTLSGYPCCTTNMHQSWPKFVQNLFYATPDGGLAALQYAPSSVSMKVADNVNLKITESTGFPFKEKVDFSMQLSQSATFPFHLRIPPWANQAFVKVNGERVDIEIEDGLVILEREWKTADKVSLTLPMEITTSKWHEFSTTIERGPLVYSLKIEGQQKIKERGDEYRDFIEVFALEPWNFGLIQNELNKLPESVKVIESDWDGNYPWNLENAPIALKIKGLRLDQWKAEGGIPYLPAVWGNYREDTTDKIKEIILVPYGCTTLRITQFPVVNFN